MGGDPGAFLGGASCLSPSWGTNSLGRETVDESIPLPNVIK